MSYRAQDSHPRHRKSRAVENALVLQGGGSLGAFGCGVFKALSKKGIRFDMIAGTSIGAINAAIIAGSKNYGGEEPARDLEDFWTEIAESSVNVIPDFFMPEYDNESKSVKVNRRSSAHLNAMLFGVPKMFVPRWNWLDGSGMPLLDGESLHPASWTYAYSHAPLVKVLEKYVDYGRLDGRGDKSSSSARPRLIMTAVDVLTAESLVFDSAKIRIEPKHLLASSAYSSYGFPWIKVNDGVYAWDGALLSNTPLREVIEASPRNDKNVYVVENYPRQIDRLPANMVEVADRTRDIIFSDKTLHDIRTSKQNTRQVELIENLYDIFENQTDVSKLDPERVSKLRKEYGELVEAQGAEILSVNKIMRDRMASPHLLKNADFSPTTVKELIAQGERKTIEYLKSAEENAEAIAELFGSYYQRD